MEQATIESASMRVSPWRWLLQGMRTAVFVRPDWTTLRTTPAFLAFIVVTDLLVSILAGRLYIVGPATFFWRSLGFGWTWTIVVAWACWLALRRDTPSAEKTGNDGRDAPTLFTLLYVQLFVFTVVISCVYCLLFRGGFEFQSPGGRSAWLLALLPFLWMALAQARVAWFGAATAAVRPRVLLVALVVAMLANGAFLMPFGYWQPDGPAHAATRATAAGASASGEAQAGADSGPPEPMLKLSQGVFESQQRLLATQLDGIEPGRPGVVDMYAVTFAPYADVDVFMRESAVVAGVMESRFDTRGRTLQLVNNVATVDSFAWATPMNLKRGIERMAQRMNRDEDILFLHLTSHGGADGRLAADFFPLTVDQLTPQMLRRWLDDAGVRNRVISISACFSGSWIAPLASADTLVMTAADADHTSYGCGSQSTLTFFGQAMYDEQLRHTWSFEQAHAASRKLIDQRERAAGKDDGYSNPQISVGPRIRARLKLLEARLAASAAR